MDGENDDKNNNFNAKFRMQIDLQQTEESLRRVKNEIINLEIQIRKYRQEFTRTKMNLDAAEARLKLLKNQEYELSQTSARQKRAYISQK